MTQTPMPSLSQLRMAADYESVRRQLKGGSIGSVVFGALAVVLGVTNFNIINAILIAIGLALIGGGVVILLTMRPGGFIFLGVTLLLIAAWNVAITVLNMAFDPGGRSPVIWAVLGVLQIVWGVRTLGQYKRFAHLPYQAPPKELADWIAGTVRTISGRRAKDCPEIIEFVSSGFMATLAWRGSLWPDIVVFLKGVGAGREVLFETRDRVALMAQPPERRRQKGNQATLQIADRRYKVRINRVSLDRLEAWIANVVPPNLPPPASV